MDLNSFEDKYDGKRIFVVGNGPSLKETPLDSLTGEDTIAMNKIDYIYSEVKWRPSFYCFLIDEIEKKADSFARKRAIQNHINQGIPCFINSELRPKFGDEDNIYYIDTKSMNDNEESLFRYNRDCDPSKISQSKYNLQKYWSYDISDFIYFFHSIYAVIQIVQYMGYDEIYFVGCDLGYNNKKPHMIFDDGLDPFKYSDKENVKLDYLKHSIKKNSIIKSGVNGLLYKILSNWRIKRVISKITEKSEDSSYFTSSYNVSGPKNGEKMNWEMERSHEIIKRVTKRDGIRCYNATIGGELETYPRVKIDNIIRDI